MTGRLAIGVLVPPLAWATQLVAGYSIEEAGCGRPDSSLWGAGVEPLLLIVVIVCGVATVVAALVSFWALRSTAGGAGGVERFLATAGLLGAPVFLFAIVLGGIAIGPLAGCDAG